MNAITRDDHLFADTPHARLARRALRSTAMRETRYERITEAVTTLYEMEAVPKNKRVRYEATKVLAEQGFELVRRYAELLEPKDERILYDQIEAIIAVRRRRLES